MPAIADHNLTTTKQRRARRSLRWRVLIALLLVFALGFGISVVHLYGTRDELRRALLLIQAEAASSGFSRDHSLSNLPREFAGGELGYTLYGPEGQLVSFSDYLGRPRKLRSERLTRHSHWWRWSPYGGNTVNVPIPLPDGSTLMVTRTDTAERAMLNELLLDRLRHSLIFVLPLGLIAASLILLLLNWTLRPVRLAARLVQSIGPATPGRRIPLDDLPDEFHPLATAANRALDRLADAYAGERRFIADAAHELRTPLTVLDLRLQDARRSGETDWPVLESEMRQLRRLVAQLLELARQDGTAERGLAEHIDPPRPANISRTVREATAALLPLFEAQRRSITVDIENGLYCQGNTDQLREAMVNLLDNALTHGAGAVEVTLRSQSAEIILEVADQGPGVTPEQQELMFERFRKGRQGSHGTGLGLAIARRIVENAGGDIHFVADRQNALRMVLRRANSRTENDTGTGSKAL